ncbi:MAG: hypothetical protein FWF03_07690, partial [Defluviitaleaceae bacterium]|nr:hypothetical protein [Defluviitaleaceae bacterium]
MKNKLNTFISFFIAAILLTGLLGPAFPKKAYGMNAVSLAAHINSVGGFAASASGASVTVTPSSGSPTYPIVLEIDSDVTVNWNASVTGNTNQNIITISGSGTFNLASSFSITNSGSGSAVYVAGGGTKINCAGSIINNGKGTAISVVSGISGVEINISGTVSSVPDSYAINDGTGTNNSTNNTLINVSGNGTVAAGNACAIRSTGSGSVVTVSGSGSVSNNAASNSNPVIYMNGDPEINYPFDNVILKNNAEVKTNNVTSSTSYVIQTTGNILVEDDAKVTAYAGRAINLVGQYSTATVKGGEITATSGIAISAATTKPAEVPNVKIIVEGGKVKTDTGTAAIQTTGINNVVEISGGWVTATTGFAVRALTTVLSGRIDVSGGFVFAYGNNESQVISSPGSSPININNPGNGVVVAWNKVVQKPTYAEGTKNDLTVRPAEASDVYWHHNGPVEDGIWFDYGGNTGFYKLDVTVTQYATRHDGLIFDIASGKFYIGEVGGTEYPAGPDWDWNSGTLKLTLTNFNWVSDTPVALTILGGDSIIIDLVGANTFVSIGEGAGAAGIASVASIAVEGSGELYASAIGGMGINMSGAAAANRSFTMNGGTVSASSGNLVNTHGLNVGALTINGGNLYASSGGPATTGAFYGVNAASLTISNGSGVLTASGSSRAINSITGPNLNLPDGYRYFRGSRADGGGAGEYCAYPGGGTPYVYSASNNYVRIQAMSPHTLTVNDGTTNPPYDVALYEGQTVSIATSLPLQGVVTPTTQPPYLYEVEREVFKSWEAVGGGTFGDAVSRATVYTMPGNDATVTAVKQTAYKLWVEAGYIVHTPGLTNVRLGYFLEGTQIQVATFGAFYGGEQFKEWNDVTTRGAKPDDPAGTTYIFPGG